MIESLIFFDKELTNFFFNLFPHNLFFNYFFSFFSLKGYSFLIWLFVIFTSLFLEERKNPGISKKDKQFIFAFIFSFVITILIIELPFKNLFQRQRPTTDLKLKKNSIASCPSSFSFPSGHAGTAFASAFVLSFFDKKRKFFYFFIAGLIAYSRIFLGCHYFLDVVGGALIGLLISLALTASVRFL